ncbi:conjugal transfer protein TraD [Legionella pneumophila]|uniref:conjugal transfer protein TraD n=1 Tax=Legionella pneumophila TaxID=446 RepID=UPI0007708CB1|nr:conjugal transfer protein TraD [Legionella pneumophila]CZJ15141.1 Conjugal transfer protein TraD [Legionella pneumophila]CZJ27740.1 Conjugal transfer protein TraD [Legionella pneumophila]CZJ27852.1 Conjugal transfer protein TraD [Legionella pneumophila]CZJ28321.1 Conjugal transfer protein TraD [Legionella pneumophila]CZJ32402.1 Conjugal transfer protein TraD [Legionella pneumophila]
MTMLEEIEKEKQLIARCERSLALEKLKKRRADTRCKIEWGGLVAKSGMNKYSKLVILGALAFSYNLIQKENKYLEVFEVEGENLFSKKPVESKK